MDQSQLREIDAQVAELVMGLKVKRSYHGNLLHAEYSYPLPHYSTTWEGAGLVIERMLELGWLTNIWRHRIGFDVWMDFDDYEVRHPRSAKAEADAAPLAVCLAALKAIGGDICKPTNC